MPLLDSTSLMSKNNGPRQSLSTGRNRNTVINDASKAPPTSKSDGLRPTKMYDRPDLRKQLAERSKTSGVGRPGISTPASSVNPGVDAPEFDPGQGQQLTTLMALLMGNQGGGKGPDPTENLRDMPRIKGQGGSIKQNIALGRKLASGMYGWQGKQFKGLYRLWDSESGWDDKADNPNSSAYGIPQGLTALHGLGKKYMNSPRRQILWGLNYVKQNYRTPMRAWLFKLATMQRNASIAPPDLRGKAADWISKGYKGY